MEFLSERLLSPVRCAHSCDIELNTGREIPAIYTNKQPCIIFCHINTIYIYIYIYHISRKLRKKTLD